MDRTIDFRLVPTGEKARMLNSIKQEMSDLSEYVVQKYEDELHGEGKLSAFALQKAFAYSNSPFDLKNQSTVIKKRVYFESLVEKITPNLKNWVNGNTRKPKSVNCIHFRTRVVEFTQTEKGYWGITINHPNKRGEKIFIKLAEGQGDRVEDILEDDDNDQFTCEIHKNDNGKWILSVMIDIGEAPEAPDNEEIENIIGVDLGLRFVATATVLDRKEDLDARDPGQLSLEGFEERFKDVKFFRGGELFKKRKELNRRMQELQKKGEKNAYNRLKNKDGEIMKNKNHEVSKELVEFAEDYKPCVIVFEDLEGSKDEMKEESFKESGDIKGSSGRYKNRLLSFWSPSMLKEFVEYKAEEAGITVKEVPPRGTSHECPKCGHQEKGNRKPSAHKFICQECNYEVNDDLVGAMNIAKRGDEKILG